MLMSKLICTYLYVHMSLCVYTGKYTYEHA